MSVKILRLDHLQIAIPAGGDAQARIFYGQILGLAEVPKPQTPAARGGLWFECGPLQVHLGVEEDFRPAKKAHPAFIVEDFAALLHDLRQAKYEVIEDHSLAGITRAFTCDPFGNRIELIASAARTTEAGAP